MPIYEYRCGSCGHELEAIQKVSDAPLTDCPKCGAAALTKKISAAGFRLKGGGWYETDFKSKGKKNVAGSDDGAGTGSKDKSDGGSAGDAKGGDAKSGKGDGAAKGSSGSSSAATPD